MHTWAIAHACAEMAESTDDTGGGYIAPELRVERERSKLVLEELRDYFYGKEYMEIKHEMGTSIFIITAC